MTKHRPVWLFPATVAALVGLAVYFRLTGSAWDAGAGLHPDERHMIFTLSAMLERWRDAPELSPWVLWFGTGLSPLDPRLGGVMYGYGEAPLLALAPLARLTDTRNWGELLLLGRQVTAIVDAVALLGAMRMAWLLSSSRRAVLLAGLLYATAPTALQLANFYTVDSWLAAASAWAGVAMISAVRARTGRRTLAWTAAAGAAAGLAMACKLPGVLLGLPALSLLVVTGRRFGPGTALSAGAIGIGCALAVFRLGNPFAFAGTDLAGLAPSSAFLASLRAIASLYGNPDFPPNWQWLAGSPWPGALRDMVLFLLGPALAFGLVLSTVERSPGRSVTWLLVAGPLLFCLWVGQPMLRYMAPALPAAAALAGVALLRWRVAALSAAAVALLWGAGTARLHHQVHPRIAATQFLAAFPPGTRIAYETAWDESLPVYPAFTPLPVAPDRFLLLDLDLTATDDPAKAERLSRIAAEADLIVISSGRQRQVMPRLAQRFPLTAAWYQGLFSGAFCYVPILDLPSRFPLPLLPFADGWAQETWRVYDHPAVTILARQPCYDATGVRAHLNEALGRAQE